MRTLIVGNSHISGMKTALNELNKTGQMRLDADFIGRGGGIGGLRGFHIDEKMNSTFVVNGENNFHSSNGLNLNLDNYDFIIIVGHKWVPLGGYYTRQLLHEWINDLSIFIDNTARNSSLRVLGEFLKAGKKVFFVTAPWPTISDISNSKITDCRDFHKNIINFTNSIGDEKLIIIPQPIDTIELSSCLSKKQYAGVGSIHLNSDYYKIILEIIAFKGSSANWFFRSDLV